MKKEVDKKYTWDLSKIFNTYKEFCDGIEEVKKILKKLLKLKGEIFTNDKTLLEYYTLNDSLNILLEKVYLYPYLGFSSNMDVKSWQEKRELALKLTDDVSQELSFILPELLKSDIKEVNKILDSNDKLKQYKFDMETTFRYKKHILSESEEKILSSVSPVLRTSNETFNSLNNLDVKFDKIKDEKGKKVELTNSNYKIYIESKNRRVRKEAFDALYKYYSSHINILASLYISRVKANEFERNVRNYNSALESSLYSDNIDKKLYESLIKVTNNNVNFLQKYYKIKAKILGIPKPHMYDTYVNVDSIPNKKIDYEKGKELILNALQPLGERYIKDITHLLNNRCVDVYPKKAKKSGAYQTGSYGIEPYVSLNYENNVDSVSTLAHEMGHAMHSYYSDKNNIYCYAGYPIFLAEIASTVNEILFSEYMSKNCNSVDEKMYFVVEFLDKFKATVYRQTMFAEFEYIIHDKYEIGESLTKDLLCDTYFELNKKQFGTALTVDKEIKYEWSRIPHFYRSFYVYKYATGFICAAIIANKLINNEKGFKEKYIKFLESGGSDYPLNILEKLGVDITDESVISDAFKLFDSKVNELSELFEKKGE